MRPVRFVALSEDGQAFVLADEVGRLLALPIDERVHVALRPDRETAGGPAPLAVDSTPSLAPRDIQARIRSGESADEVARAAGVPVDRVLRYAGPVLQERAMLAQHARRTKLRTSDKGQSLAEVVDARLSQHGIDTDKISWDAYRREDGTWRITATWPSGKATAQAVWELDKARQQVTPYDDMAQYLCSERAPHLLGAPPAVPDRPLPARGESSRGDLGGRDGMRGGHEPMRPSAAPEPVRRPGVRPNDPIRAGRDALLASLDRPLGGSSDRSDRNNGDRGAATLDHRPHETPQAPAASTDATGRGEGRARGAAALIGRSPFEEDGDPAKEIPSVPSLAVLRPRRTNAAASEQPAAADKPRKRLPSWDDVLFGGAPAQ